MSLKLHLRDWEIAQMMFGKNTKKECKLVAQLRLYGIIEPLCDYWSIITDKRLKDDGGWLIPNTALNSKSN